MALSSTCGNCANACLLNNPERAQLNIIHCIQWTEILPITHGCEMFQTHEQAKKYVYQDFKTRTIEQKEYPFKQI